MIEKTTFEFIKKEAICVLNSYNLQSIIEDITFDDVSKAYTNNRGLIEGINSIEDVTRTIKELTGYNISLYIGKGDIEKLYTIAIKLKDFFKETK